MPCNCHHATFKANPSNTTKPESDVEPEALELYEAAVALAVGRKTIRRMCQRHELPHFHIGRRGDYRVIKPPEGWSWPAWLDKARAEAWRCSRCPPRPTAVPETCAAAQASAVQALPAAEAGARN